MTGRSAGVTVSVGPFFTKFSAVDMTFFWSNEGDLLLKTCQSGLERSQISVAKHPGPEDEK